MLSGASSPCFVLFQILLLFLQHLSQVRVWLDKLHEKFFRILIRIALNSEEFERYCLPVHNFSPLSLYPGFVLQQMYLIALLAYRFCCQYKIACWWLLNYRKKRKGYEDDDYVSKKSKHEEVCSPKVNFKLSLLYILVQP